jgi:hypothetical protein
VGHFIQNCNQAKEMVLVHLEGNDGKTRVKRNHQSCLGNVGLPYFLVKG